MLPKMFPIVASQAVAVSQAKRDASKASGERSAERHAPDGQTLLCNAVRRAVRVSQASGDNGDTAPGSLAR